MKCSCCNKTLTDYEATLRHAHTGEFTDTCVKCLKGLSIPTTGRDDLLGKQEAAEDLECNELDTLEVEAGNFDLGLMFDD